ncbi:hypothetical protein PoB_001896100 [Plakobranchus ocellatus]|uniref:Uncharacterized protein n=1 Tax=Plakobranchus ocellatus TaxID=259542 RepID=A0AAV3ZCU2_9GAST|nr:hypothetical protein PoB_001896100 [Plakobranchus ocellatus]
MFKSGSPITVSDSRFRRPSVSVFTDKESTLIPPFIWTASRSHPQQGDLRLSGPASDQGAGSGARTRDRRLPADLRADSQATVLPTPPFTIKESQIIWEIKSFNEIISDS